MEAVKFVGLLAFSFQLTEQDLISYRIGMILQPTKPRRKNLFRRWEWKARFIRAGDIAAVAFHIMTNEKLDETDYRVLGCKLST